jgi:hypothetical protein
MDHFFGTLGTDWLRHVFCIPDSKSFAPRSCYPKKHEPGTHLPPPTRSGLRIFGADPAEIRDIFGFGTLSEPTGFPWVTAWLGHPDEASPRKGDAQK